MLKIALRKLAAALTAMPLMAPVHEAAAQAPAYLGWTRDFVNYFMLLPDDDHLAWTGQGMVAWNRLVGRQSRRPVRPERLAPGLPGRCSGNPMRNRLQSPDNGNHELGVLTSMQMADRGYRTWEHLGANGVNYQWRQNSGPLASVIIENDTFITPRLPMIRTSIARA